MAIEPLKIKCPHCKADWSYGWPSLYHLLGYFRDTTISFFKCYNCQVCWTRNNFMMYVKELIEIE